jgi:hypothetical protein
MVLQLVSDDHPGGIDTHCNSVALDLMIGLAVRPRTRGTGPRSHFVR